MAATEQKTPIITFSRRKRVPVVTQPEDSEKIKAVASVLNSPAVSTPSGAESYVQDESDKSESKSGAVGPRWRRFLAAKSRAADHVASLTELKSYYEEVDAYDLAVETPSPPLKQAAKLGTEAQGEKEQAKQVRHMSLGLSRRSSMLGIPLGGMPALSVASPFRKPAPSFRPSGVGLAEGKQEKARRSSAATAMLARMSTGVHDALHWLGAKGISPIAERDEVQTTDHGIHSGVADAEHEVTSLTADLQKLVLQEEIKSTEQLVSVLSPLQQLLKLCAQEAEEDCLPSMEELLRRQGDMEDVRKIGEGTFGEAFKANNAILKIVPMDGETLVNGEQQKRLEEILAEVIVTLTLSSLRQDCDGSEEGPQNRTSAFVETMGVGICKGHYCDGLIEEWRRWDAVHGSENDPVDIFNKDQLFVVFTVADGGFDLEHFQINSFAELRSIVLQVTLALAVAEEACSFEHRDLHWGNVLIKRDGAEKHVFKLRGVNLEAETAGVTVTLIDFTLSRLQTETGEVAYCDLSTDPALFQGPKRDFQAETYRRMRKATQDDWSLFSPKTNCLWLWYLADILLTEKLPVDVCTKSEIHDLRRFRKRAAMASAATELVWDEFFAGMWEST